MVVRHNIDDEIAKLKKDIRSMAELCVKALKEDLSLINGSNSDLSEIEEIGRQIEKANSEFESSCMLFLIRRHPVARDFRSITACLRIIGDLDRIGNNSLDLAYSIASCNDREILFKIGIDKMAKEVLKMLELSLDAFSSRDSEKAEDVIKSDDDLDLLFQKAKDAVSEILTTSSECVKDIPDALLAAKYLERMGDHAANISKHLFWAVSGEKSSF